MKSRKAFMVISLAAIIGLLLPMIASAAATIGKATRVQGTVQIFRAGRDLPIIAVQGMEVFQQDRVKTAAKAYLRIELTDGSILSIGEKAEMNLAEYDYDPAAQKRTASFDMTLGKVRVFTKGLAKLKANNFTIKTPTAVVGVRGTLFMVWVISDSLTRVTCLDSAVEVYSLMEPDKVIILNPNDTTDILRGKAPTAPKTITRQESLQQQQGTSAGSPAAAKPVASANQAGRSIQRVIGVPGAPASDSPVPDFASLAAVVSTIDLSNVSLAGVAMKIPTVSGEPPLAGPPLDTPPTD